MKFRQSPTATNYHLQERTKANLQIITASIILTLLVGVMIYASVMGRSSFSLIAGMCWSILFIISGIEKRAKAKRSEIASIAFEKREMARQEEKRYQAGLLKDKQEISLSK